MASGGKCAEPVTGGRGHSYPETGSKEAIVELFTNAIARHCGKDYLKVPLRIAAHSTQLTTLSHKACSAHSKFGTLAGGVRRLLALNWLSEHRPQI